MRDLTELLVDCPVLLQRLYTGQPWATNQVVRSSGPPEVEQRFRQCLQLLQLQRLDAGRGGLAEEAAAAGQQTQGTLQASARRPS